MDTTPHDKYLATAAGAVGIKGRSVLEVGGSTPPEKIVRYRPKRWMCVNLNADAVERFNRSAAELGTSHLKAVRKDINDFVAEGSFDLIYSINCFEHVHDLQGALRVMHASLQHDGYLFTLFGPIWSCDVGHHLSIPLVDGGALHFTQGVLAPWEHLTASRDTLFARLTNLYGEEPATRAIQYIYDSNDLNRLFERDYLRVLEESPFQTALVLRNRHGKPPDIDGATNTREFVWVLKRGRINMLDKARSIGGFVGAYLSHRMARKLRI